MKGVSEKALLLINHLSKGNINWFNKDPFNYLTIQFNLNSKLTQLDIIKKINSGIQRELSKNQKEIENLKKIWSFIQKIELGGFKIRNEGEVLNESEIFDNFVYSLADTAKKIIKEGYLTEKEIKAHKKGILILIDEADSADRHLGLGTFLKNLQESLLIEDCSNILFVLAGLPKIKNVLLESHKSSLRMFEEMELNPFSSNEIKSIYDKGVEEVNEKIKPEKISITEKALEAMISVSEGYPHFAQQIGYSIFEKNDKSVIDFDNAWSAIKCKGGAIDRIGDRYYYDLYYNKISEDAYREILNIIANSEEYWVPKKYIREKFKRKDHILNNGLKALRDRNIIISKEGTRGVYKLQWVGFSVWIKLFCQKDKE